MFRGVRLAILNLLFLHLDHFDALIMSVVDPDPVGSTSFGRIRILIVTEKTDPERIRVVKRAAEMKGTKYLFFIIYSFLGSGSASKLCGSTTLLIRDGVKNIYFFRTSKK